MRQLETFAPPAGYLEQERLRFREDLVRFAANRGAICDNQEPPFSMSLYTTPSERQSPSPDGSLPEYFSLLLFSTDPARIREAVAAGVDAVLVDWENRGKQQRQADADTEINHDTLDDLRRVRAATDARVICRINGYAAESTPGEVADATEAGADELLLPMARSPEEVERTLTLAKGRAGVGMLIETTDAVRRVHEFAALPLARVYVGLNDLAIERRTPNLFTAVADGTLEAVRRAISAPFGFGGLTLPERGWPIPCRLLIGEMARLGCSFSFLRRSFRADTAGRDLRVEAPRIRQALAEAAARSPAAVAADRRRLVEAIEAWRPKAAGAG